MPGHEISKQREVYKLVEDLSLGNFSNELDYLKHLVQDVVAHSAFEITGGRIWEFDSEHKTYRLRYQHGDVKHIPDDYELGIDDYPIIKDLVEIRTTLSKEQDPILKQSGIQVYSITGVGDIIKTPYGKFFKYALGFNAPEILKSFFETLNIISSVATINLRRLVSEEEKRKLRKDLIKASEIQRNLFPDHYLEFEDYKIFGVCIPDSEVGGDFFDYMKSNDDGDESVAIVVSDAASKGLAAAVQSLFVSGAIRMAKEFSPKVTSMLARLNSLIFDTFPYERFVTLFYCELTKTSNRLVIYANAGHCAPIHYRPETGQYTMMNPTGGLLGIVRQQRFQVENVQLNPGDVLAIYSDGIIDAQNSKGEAFGEQRLMDLIRDNAHLGPREINYNIIEEVQKFSINCNYNDDKTLIIVKRDAV